ncbi:MAG: STAS domain-containing protein [Pyrinomonadaceae bacterium]|nr:STAS domain-containing protein [Pyrinomonadaceae bacterium]
MNFQSLPIPAIPNNKTMQGNENDVSVETEGDKSVVYATDYLNKLTGEKIERECKRQLDAGCKTLVVNFAETEIVNSIGISILLGVIDAAADKGAAVVFSDVNDDTIQLFEMLGLTNHVAIQG